MSDDLEMNGRDRWRTGPLYTIPETARLAGVSTTTVRRWLFGTREQAAVFADAKTTPFVSFVQLVEIVIASKFRKADRIKLEVVRRAYENAQRDWGTPYPFASLRLEALGGHIVRRMMEEKPGRTLQAVDEPRQRTLPGLVIEAIHNLEYEKELAARWYPLGKVIPIVVDPQFSAGLPTIPSRRVTVRTIHKRWSAGQAISFIARDLRLKHDTVEEALRYADRVAA